MDDAPSSDPSLKSVSRRFARRLLTLLENRLELLNLEIHEGRERLLYDLLLALGVAAAGLLAGLSLTAALAVLFWSYSPFLALLLMTVLFATTGFYLAWLLRRRLRDWEAFSASVDQLRKDRACLDTLLT